MNCKMSFMEVQELIDQINECLKVHLVASPIYSEVSTNPLSALMAFRKGQPKYLIDKQKLVGLNLSEIKLSDDSWVFIVKLLNANQVYLRGLNISYNNLRELKMPYTRDLEKFEVQGNNLRGLPKNVLAEGNKGLLLYFKQIEEQQGTEPLYEAKLLIVGQPGAGKTTLQKKLENPEYVVPEGGDKEVLSTLGVQIMEGWDFPYTTSPTGKFMANIWDFGGQEIQYMTHHFFLTPRALYVLVADERKQNTEFDYWFRIINLLGREGEEDKIHVLVVLNEIKYKSASNFDLTFYQKNYPNINIQKRHVDFSLKDKRGLDLIDTVQNMLCGLPHIGEQLPRLWALIREDLFEIRQSRPHINFTEFAGICRKKRNSQSLQDEEGQRFFSKYLHHLGIILHYQDDDALDNFVILRPQWAVDAVYSVLDIREVKAANGRFTKKNLRRYWKDYSADERNKLLSLMLKDKFEICYETEVPGEYIAPQLLSVVQPEYDWDSTDSLKFRYLYPFMPKGMISRLIVRLSTWIAEEGRLVWRDGVVFHEKGEDCKARVIQTKTVNEGLEVLDIEVTGPKAMRKYLLNRVMQEIEAIHEKSFKHISFEKMIPCICSKCVKQANPHFFEYSVLRRYQDNNIKEIRCDINPDQEVLVLLLLEGVFPYDKSGHSKWDGVLDQLEIIRQLLENNGRIVAEIPYELGWIKELIRSGIDLSRSNGEMLNQIHTKVEAIPTNDPDLDRINAVLEQHLEAIFNMMPSARAIVQEWKNAQAQPSATDIDARYKLKLKLSLLSILELEKEIAFAPKAMIKQLNQEWAEYRQGKRSLKKLFLE